MFVTNLRWLAEVCICTRELFWRKCILNISTATAYFFCASLVDGQSPRLWFTFSGIRRLVTLQTLRSFLRQTIDITCKNTISTLTLEGETLQNFAIQTPSYTAYYHKRADFSAIPLRRFEIRKTLVHNLCLCLIPAFIKERLQIRKHLYEVIYTHT